MHALCYVKTKTTTMSQKEYIIEQATEMFRQLGIKAVRMDDIAHNLGVSKRTLYELFDDKMNLLKLCMINYYETRHGYINEKISECSNVLESILTAFDLFLVEGATEQRMQTNLRRFYPALYDELSTMMQVRNRDRLRAAFQKGVDGYYLDYHGLPDGELTFTLSESEDPKAFGVGLFAFIGQIIGFFVSLIRSVIGSLF